MIFDTLRQQRNADRIRRVLAPYDLFVWRDGAWEPRKPLEWFVCRSITRANPVGVKQGSCRMLRVRKAAAK